MVPSKYNATLTRIHQALGKGPRTAWSWVTFGQTTESVRWYREALTSMVFAVGADQVLYMNSWGVGVNRAEGFTVGGDVVTPDRVVSLHATVPATGGGTPTWTVTVRGLSTLDAIDVHASAEPFEPTLDDEWPGMDEVTLRFTGGDTVTLGAGGRQESEALADVTRRLLLRLT